MMIKTIDQWQARITSEYETSQGQISNLGIVDEQRRLLALALLPVLPRSAREASALARLLETHQLFPLMAQQLKQLSKVVPYAAPTLRPLLDALTEATGQHSRTQCDYFIERLALRQVQRKHAQDYAALTPGLTVKADSIHADGPVVLAGNNATVQLGSDHAAEHLKRYLDHLRATWINLDLNTIVSDPARNVHMQLMNLYTPLDVWDYSLSAERLNRLRRSEVDFDQGKYRLTTITAIANEQYLVITGGPGTGKSTLSGFITICLAFACDADASSKHHVNGLERLTADWQHGAHLPIYVELRGFAADTANFPKAAQKESANNLLAHLRDRMPGFETGARRYLDDTDKLIRGTILILDGLDEIYDEKDRCKVRTIIEDFAARYPKTRIIVTCRTAGYHHQARWRLSERFKVVELAPYTWEQIKHYVDNWYAVAAVNRPSSLGNRENAAANALKYATDLKNNLHNNRNLWSLAQQPLLLTLIALIHEEHRHLPHNRGALYEKTVSLLHRWNLPLTDDAMSNKLASLNFERVRQALQLTAFNLQCDPTQYAENACIRRANLLEQLLTQSKTADGLGAAIEDVLEYLATRNGILVSDQDDTYRFLHLSIQEYLAACALIEQYDELRMPRPPRSDMQEWNFPDNICALLNSDPYRWREVAIFCGAILGGDRGQDRLWAYVETLLPTELNHTEEGDVYRICIAGEVWAGNLMKPRRPSHHMIGAHLMRALKTIRSDERLDAPERTQIATILRLLSDMEIPKSTSQD